MSKSFRFLAAFVLCNFLTIAALAQTTTVSGNVRSSANQEVVPAVSVTLKGGTAGTFTDEKGNFRLTTSQQPPFVLVFSKYRRVHGDELFVQSHLVSCESLVVRYRSFMASIMVCTPPRQ